MQYERYKCELTVWLYGFIFQKLQVEIHSKYHVLGSIPNEMWQSTVTSVIRTKAVQVNFA